MVKKWIVAALCALALCLAASGALADSWGFLHSAFRLTSSADMARLAAENGVTLTHTAEIGQWDYLAGGVTIGDIAPTSVWLQKTIYKPTFDCYLYFDIVPGSTENELRQTYRALVNALTAKYGEPTGTNQWSSRTNAGWTYRDVSISMYYVAPMKGSSLQPYIMLVYSGQPYPDALATDEGKAFPYPAADYAAKAYAEAIKPFSLRNGVHGGMTMDQVIAAEGRQPDARTDGSLTYSGLTIDGRNATLLYRFEFDWYGEGYADGEETQTAAEAEAPWLAYAQVLFTDPEADKNAYAAAYKTIDQALAKQFGADFFGDGQWYVPPYGAESGGSELAMCTTRAVQDAIIAHLLEVRGSALQHGILYTFYGQTNCEPEVDVLTWPQDMLGWGD